jgi:valyl-tRNA synthetase
LSKKNFVEQAPPSVVEGAQKMLADNVAKYSELEKILTQLNM